VRKQLLKGREPYLMDFQFANEIRMKIWRIKITVYMSEEKD
jgi:hypothetical protein